MPIKNIAEVCWIL